MTSPAGPAWRGVHSPKRTTTLSLTRAGRPVLAVVEQGHGKLILDLAEVGFMDSSGLSVLVSVFKAARLKNGDVVLLHLNPTVRSLVELTRLHQVFSIFDDETMALARLR